MNLATVPVLALSLPPFLHLRPSQDHQLVGQVPAVAFLPHLLHLRPSQDQRGQVPVAMALSMPHLLSL